MWKDWRLANWCFRWVMTGASQSFTWLLSIAHQDHLLLVKWFWRQVTAVHPPVLVSDKTHNTLQFPYGCKTCLTQFLHGFQRWKLNRSAEMFFFACFFSSNKLFFSHGHRGINLPLVNWVFFLWLFLWINIVTGGFCFCYPGVNLNFVRINPDWRPNISLELI